MKATIAISEDIRQLIQINISTEDFRCVPGVFGQNDAGKWGFIVDWDNLPQRYIDLCGENLAIIEERANERNNKNVPLVGDFLEMPDGSISRITYCHDSGVQDGGGSGSFYLHNNGNASYSGGLDGLKPYDKIKPTGRTKKALFWIFSRNHSGGNRGFSFYLDVKIWRCEGMLKTAYVKFEKHGYNYHTNINGELSNEEARACFVGKWFNLGDASGDDMQYCIDAVISY